MIKLEGEPIKDFNPDAAIQYWFEVITRRPGGSQSKTLKNQKRLPHMLKLVVVKKLKLLTKVQLFKI